jgi:hypothetical protein
VAQSLRFAGTLAYLEQNADLLSEVALCMVYASIEVPRAWHGLVAQTAQSFAPEVCAGASEGDDGHCFWVCNWYLAKAGLPAFARALPRLPQGQTLGLWAAPSAPGALRDLARLLWAPGGRPWGEDWGGTRAALVAALPDEARLVLARAEGALPDFAAFFAAFARRSAPPLAPLPGPSAAAHAPGALARQGP